MASESAAFVTAATAQLQICVSLFKDRDLAAALSCLEKLVEYCENHPRYVREWAQLDVLTEIVKVCASTVDVSPRIGRRSLKLMRRIEGLKAAIN
jgi:transposase-like protein